MLYDRYFVRCRCGSYRLGRCAEGSIHCYSCGTFMRMHVYEVKGDKKPKEAVENAFVNEHQAYREDIEERGAMAFVQKIWATVEGFRRIKNPLPDSREHYTVLPADDRSLIERMKEEIELAKLEKRLRKIRDC